jgi:CBS domain containing-hemolysin-like protein
MDSNLIAGLVCLVIGLINASLLKVFYFLPTNEVKRRAEEPGSEASVFYKAISYGSSLKILLWLILIVSLAASFTLLAESLPGLISVVILSCLILYIFLYQPIAPLSNFSITLAKLLTPLITSTLNKLEPAFDRINSLIKSIPLAPVSTNIFESEDLVQLIKRQKKQIDNRVSEAELARLVKVLEMNQKTISSIMTPKKKVKALFASDTIGPILIDDIHKSHQEFVLVKESDTAEIVGTLAFKDLNIRSRGQVKDHMKSSLIYLNENDLIVEVVNAFYQTNQLIYVVVNNIDEYVGVVSIQDAIKSALGKAEGEFNSYDNRQAVAHRYDAQEATKEPEPEPPVKTDD